VGRQAADGHSQPGAAPPSPPPLTLAPTAFLTQAAGAEFFRRRLQRAAAIPPDQRDPAVHAFVTSVQLMNAADALLPLTADGQPALPAHTLAGQQAEVQAMALKATAMHICLEELEWEGRQLNRLGRYLRRMALAGDCWEVAYPPSLQPLGGLLLRRLIHLSPVLPLQQSSFASSTAEKARSARCTISRQLQQAQRSIGQQVLTAEQFEAELHSWAIHQANRAFVDCALQRVSHPVVPPSVEDTLIASSERLLVLEPACPVALRDAAMGFMACAVDMHGTARAARSLALAQRGLDCFMSAFRAAEAVHSAYYATKSALPALGYAAAPALAVSNSDLAALIAAVEQAPTAVKRLKGVLPHSWVASLQAEIAGAQGVLPPARLRLQGGSDTADEEMAVLQALALETAAEAEQALTQDARNCACSGCGRHALGLRRCARCKQAACE